MKLSYNRAVSDYIELVRHGEHRSCDRQLALCDFIERIFRTEKLRTDDALFEKYMNLEKYFPFKLFEWERFIFYLHNCVYREDGLLRFPDLLTLCGRGAGKNGYISFQSFALSSAVHGVKNYDIDIFATAEDQAKTSPNEIRSVLEANNLQKWFYWNKETITNLTTGSVIRFRTSSAKTKDGGRPGMVVFDEYHAYENYDLVSVAETGLGKKLYPRKDIFTTDGNVRGGPLDDLKERADDILLRGADDMGLLPFVCCLDDPDEVKDKANWFKANPSLQYFPTLYNEIEKEYARYVSNPAASSDFMTKRMNLPPTIMVNDVASWEDICATNRLLPNLEGKECVLGIDYAKTSDMVSAGLLFYVNEEYYWITHSWVCAASPAIQNVKAPLDEWRNRGLLTFVEANEVSPDIVIDWAMEMGKKYNITKIGMDNFRITLFRKALIAAGFDVDDKNRVMLMKRVTQMRYAPVIQSAFINHKIAWGDNPLMRWFTNNTLADIDKQGNIVFGKKNAKYRMTDGFMALAAAFGASAELVESPNIEIDINDIMTFTG